MTTEQNRLRSRLAEVLIRPDLAGDLELVRARLATLAAEPSPQLSATLIALEREHAIGAEIQRGHTFSQAVDEASQRWPELFFGGDPVPALGRYYARLLRRGQTAAGSRLRRAFEHVAVGGAI